MPKVLFDLLGLFKDMRDRVATFRTYCLERIIKARGFIYRGNTVNGSKVQATVGEGSWVLTVNTFVERLGPLGFDTFHMLVVDFMYECELGTWKALFTHLIRLLYTLPGGDRLVASLDYSKLDIPAELAKHERRRRVLRRVAEAGRSSCTWEQPPVNLPAGINMKNHHYIPTLSRNNPMDIFNFLRDHDSDPAVAVFIPKLKDHVLYRLRNLDITYCDHTFSDDEHNLVIISDNRLYSVQTMQVHYTTYDLRREYDTVNTRTHPDIMVLSGETGPQHPYWYARILGIYHMDVWLNNKSLIKKRHIEVLYVRWLAPLTNHQSGMNCARLPKIAFVEESDRDAFGFLDPSQVIRSAHLIPAFSSNRGTTSLRYGKSLGRQSGELDDWEGYYVGIFVDRDMFMRYTHYEIGHPIVLREVARDCADAELAHSPEPEENNNNDDLESEIQPEGGEEEDHDSEEDPDSEEDEDMNAQENDDDESVDDLDEGESVDDLDEGRWKMYLRAFNVPLILLGGGGYRYNEGDSAADGSPTPFTPTPSPRQHISQVPPTESEENATTPTINSLIFAKDKEVEMPLATLHQPPAQTPAPMEDDTMSDLLVVTPSLTPARTKPPATSQTSEEDLLRAHLAVAKTNCSIIGSNGINSLTVIPHFTPIPIGGFPHIHLAHTAQLFDFQAAKVITAWRKVPHPKILIRVFDHDGKNPSVKGPILVERLRKAVSEIAHFVHQDDQDVKVSPPCPEAIKEDADHPLSFLIYNISDETKTLILDQRIWSSTEITFTAHQFRVNTPPLLLFCLHGFSTTDIATVRTAVYEVWTEDVTRWDICDILSEGDIPEDKVHTATWDFVKSLWIERLDFKVSGGILLPRYNVFAVSPTNNPSVWTKLRAYLHSLSYPSELEGNGTSVNFMPCPLCHSIAHPQGLCPFPNIPLWNGPKHSTAMKPNNANQRGKGRGRRNPA
ncbi:hypothetical protein EV702DRAFT_1199039 [Suillus placidus]|uniref:Uncharacterized protein n=1 Tax=Suillus placidus TaxID=48579 RepID=A0A9P6ZSG6_9AGAM|nr:hypothetical protein EV702DRAFT_1199039 [Suillus placidus]